MPADPRAFAAQSMLQPLQRHTPTAPKNALVDFMKQAGGAVLSKIGGAAADKLGGAAGDAAMKQFGIGDTNNPGMMTAAFGGGAPAPAPAPSMMAADRAWAKGLWGKT